MRLEAGDSLGANVMSTLGSSPGLPKRSGLRFMFCRRCAASWVWSRWVKNKKMPAAREKERSLYHSSMSTGMLLWASQSSKAPC